MHEQEKTYRRLLLGYAYMRRLISINGFEAVTGLIGSQSASFLMDCDVEVSALLVGKTTAELREEFGMPAGESWWSS